MGDFGGDCLCAFCGICCICCCETANNWCMFTNHCSGRGSSTSGCCTSWFRHSFDDDKFEREVVEEARLHGLAREEEEASKQGSKESRRNTSKHDVVDAQPVARKSMDNKRMTSNETRRSGEQAVARTGMQADARTSGSSTSEQPASRESKDRTRGSSSEARKGES